MPLDETGDTLAATPDGRGAPAARGRSVARGAAANVAGRIWLIGLNLGVVPVYLRLLGVEAYGLVGVLGSFQAIMAVMDIGLGPTLARALARRHTARDAGTAGEMRDWVRTVCTVVSATSVAFAVGVILVGRALAVHWFRLQALDVASVSVAVRLMGVVVAAQFFASLCTNGIQAVERQGLANLVSSSAVTFRAAASVVAMLTAGKTVHVFFAAQAAATLLHAAVAFITLQAVLPSSERPARFDLGLLGSQWRFALGSSGIALVSIAITQMDKLVVTRFFSLHEFGYYSVASSLAAATPVLVSPIAQACYPRFCALHAGAGEGALRDFYRLASQWITVALAGPAATVVVFSSDVLLAWTGNRDVALHAALIASLLSLGFLFNGAMNAPYSLYLAFGKTRLFLVANAVATVLLVPTMIVLVPRLGAAGAALGWLAYSAVSLGVVAPLAHSVTLPTETWRWPVYDVAFPIGAAFVAALVVRVLSGWDLVHGRLFALARVTSGFAVATGAALLVAPAARASAGRMLAARRAAAGRAPP